MLISTFSHFSEGTGSPPYPALPYLFNYVSENMKVSNPSEGPEAQVFNCYSFKQVLITSVLSEYETSARAHILTPGI